MTKTILVAGGSGFIGSILCGLLLQKGHHIVCIDNLSTGTKRNVTPFLKNKNFAFKEIDICKEEALKELEYYTFNEIYHLASPAHVAFVTKYPVQTALTNSQGTDNLLKLARTNKAKLLFASSSEAYGDPKEHPQKESYWGNVNPIGVRSGYDEGKRFGEALCMAYLREYNLQVSIARIFNTYGPNSSTIDSRVIPQFVMQALQNKPITVHGDGTQTRSFCYVSDTAKGLMALMESKHSGPFNVGNPDEYIIKDLADFIIRITGSKSKIMYVKRPEDDPKVRQPDISLIKSKLNWQPEVSFEEGLKETINYYSKILPQTHD